MAYKTQLVLYGNFRIKVLSNHPKFLSKMKKHFTHKVKGYFWSPKYKAGIWNGETSLITPTGTFPYGLLPDFLREAKKYPDVGTHGYWPKFPSSYGIFAYRGSRMRIDICNPVPAVNIFDAVTDILNYI